MNIFCKYGIHKLKIWYEDDWEICKVCVRCGEEQSISIIPDTLRLMTQSRSEFTKTLKEKRKKKLAQIKIHNELSNRNIEHIKKEILSEEVLDMVTELGGNGGYPNKIGYKVVMKDNVVVTIVK